MFFTKMKSNMTILSKLQNFFSILRFCFGVIWRSESSSYGLLILLQSKQRKGGNLGDKNIELLKEWQTRNPSLAIEKDIGKKYFTHKCQNQKLHPKDTSMFGKQSCVIIQLTGTIPP
jgi:hypothetical protein